MQITDSNCRISSCLAAAAMGNVSTMPIVYFKLDFPNNKIVPSVFFLFSLLYPLTFYLFGFGFFQSISVTNTISLHFQSVSGVIIIKLVDSVLNVNYSKSCHHFSSRKPNAMLQNTLLMPMLRKCILEPNRRCNTEITDAFIMFQSTLDLIAKRMKNTFSHSHTHAHTPKHIRKYEHKIHLPNHQHRPIPFIWKKSFITGFDIYIQPPS